MTHGPVPVLQGVMVGDQPGHPWAEDLIAWVGEPAELQRSPTSWVLIVSDRVAPRRSLVAALMKAVLLQGGVAAYSDYRVGQRLVSPGGWSVERARWRDYTGPVLLVRADLVPDTAADLRVAALAAASRSGTVIHVPEVLYRTEWREREITADQRAAALREAGAPYRLNPDGATRDPATAPITVVIPTRGVSGEVRGETTRFVDHAITSIEQTHDHEGLDYVLVVDTDAPVDFADQWRRRLGSRVTVVPVDPPFNFAAKVNAGAAVATGEVLAIVNDDVEVITPEALRTMATVAGENDVGAVGALLRYEDGSVQHAGQAFAADGVHHVGTGRSRGWLRRFADLQVDRDVTGVTAACLVQRRVVWEQSGGMDPRFPVNFNDVEYCWRLRQQGLRIVQCNTVEWFHFESRSRRAGAEVWEVELLRERMGLDTMLWDPLTPAPAVRPTRGDRRRTALGRLRGRVRRTVARQP